MPRKRIRSKRKRDKWSAELNFDLTCSFHLGGGFDHGVFDSPEEKRAAWERYRDQVMAEHRESWPGERPAAWWQFDSGIDPEGYKNKAVDEWELLLFLGELDPEELRTIRRQWIRTLRDLRDSLRYVYHYHRQGLVRYLGYIYCPWPVACETLERQADILGADAVAAWDAMRRSIIESADAYILID